MRLAELIASNFWESRGLQAPIAEFNSYPTMLTREEMRMLYAIASNPQLPDGAICDLGAFLGGSTISLAAGVRASKRTRMVHSYDRFVYNGKHFADYLANHPRRAELHAVGLGIELYHELTRDYSSLIQTYAGDFPEQPVPENIALLFIDLDKSFDLNRAVLAHVANLVPGAIVVQQDFFFPKTPWTAVTMHRLRDVIPYRGGTMSFSAIFEKTGVVTRDRLQQAVADGMSVDEVRAAYAHFIQATPRLCHKEVLEAALHRYETEPTVRSTHDYGSFAADAYYAERFNQRIAAS